MDIVEIKKRMLDGRIYSCNNIELMKEQLKRLDNLRKYNTTKPSNIKKKDKLIRQNFKKVGSNCYIEAPLYSNWFGKFVSIGDNFYANFNLHLVDDCEIEIGDNVMIGPGVFLCGATHPISPDLRKNAVQYNLPIKIGNNVWIGAGCIILPGVEIKDNSVIGAGSVVTKNIPENVVAVGNPCKVLRNITENDYQYYRKNIKIDL